MITIARKGVFLYQNRGVFLDEAMDAQSFRQKAIQIGMQAPDEGFTLDRSAARQQTMAAAILAAHDQTNDSRVRRIRFDALASHDITYVGIVQTARASGLKSFPVPYALTNCHNSLCAVGGTINEDDHSFGLSAARKYGGIYVPAHLAVIHQYVRETMAGSGKMILGSDSHTRYGALGSLGIGEGGPEIVKQLLENTYDVEDPEVLLIYLEGKTQPGVGPHDVALALIGALFSDGYAKNKILEFVGPGIADLSVDFRNGIDVMTTETTCLSSIWETDEKVAAYMQVHGRPQDYQKLSPGPIAYYEGLVHVDLSRVEPMIALPFHPSNVYPVRELAANPSDILAKVEQEAKEQFDNPNVHYDLQSKIINGRLLVDQGIIAGCAGGTFENICAAARILKDRSTGDDYFNLSVYPQSQPVNLALTRAGVMADLMAVGATLRTAFCGPCFGAGDVPVNNGFSIRHTTRNFPNREGSKPNQGQIAGVALMDARSIAATAANQGFLTSAADFAIPEGDYPEYQYDAAVYQKRVYQGFGDPKPEEALRYGPNIADWPQMYPLTDNLLLKVVTVIHDPVTTTDELIPSGETSSYRSNPMKLAEFTLSRKDPNYVPAAKAVAAEEAIRLATLAKDGGSGAEDGSAVVQMPALSEENLPEEAIGALEKIAGSREAAIEILRQTAYGSAIFARKPGDGSAREQAASCQRVLGDMANIAYEYATKRYRSNCINWGMIPFTMEREPGFSWPAGTYVYVPGIRQLIENGSRTFPAKVISDGVVSDLALGLHELTAEERAIILSGCLINDYARRAAG